MQWNGTGTEHKKQGQPVSVAAGLKPPRILVSYANAVLMQSRSWLPRAYCYALMPDRMPRLQRIVISNEVDANSATTPGWEEGRPRVCQQQLLERIERRVPDLASQATWLVMLPGWGS